MTIFWHKDAGSKATETVPPTQVFELSPLFTHPETHSADRFIAATQRRTTLIQPLFRLERDLATASNIEGAVHALSNAIDSLLEPVLSCVVIINMAAEAEEGCLLARSGGRYITQRISADTLKRPAPTLAKQAGWKSWIRTFWSPPHDMAEYLARDAVCLPFQLEEANVGIVLLWPEGRQVWAASDLQAARLALSLTSSAIHRFLLQSTIRALQEELRQRQVEVSQAQQRASRSERLACIGQVVSSVAHELNNPLTSVIGYAQLLQDAQVEDPARSSLRIIDEQAQHCRQIVQNLLGIVRPPAETPSPIDLNEMIQRTLRLRAPALEVDGIRIISDTGPQAIGVLADPHHLEQVLVNLINNAHEAMVQSSHGSTLRVTACAVEHDGRSMAQVTLEDNGPGVPESIRECIFEPYFTTKQGKGTGLGLFISKQLISDMGGNLSLDASVLCGARFVIHLPVVALDSQVHQDRAPRGEYTEAGQRCGTTLVIEDDENLGDLVERALEGICLRVIRAANGDEALQQVAQHDVDLILLDLRMPQSDGKRTYESLRNRYPFLLSRLVFTTGDVANPETRQWMESTGCPVLVKPFDLCQLRDMVHQFMRAER